MGLSNDLISQFVSVTNDTKKQKTESTVYGTVKKTGNDVSVIIDGAETPIPVESTAEVNDGERVTVMIKDHNAIVTGNMSSPAARSSDVKNIQDTIACNITAVTAEIINLQATIASITSLTTDHLTAVKAKIDNLVAKYGDIEHLTVKELDAINAEIKNITADIGTFDEISTTDLEAVNAHIQNLEAYNADFKYVSTLELNAKKADIDFANIIALESSTAVIRNLLTAGKIISEEYNGEVGNFTDYLTGVRIHGDLITANTLKANTIILEDEDGLLYRLNVNSGALEPKPYKVSYDDETQTYIVGDKIDGDVSGAEVENTFTDSGDQVFFGNSDTENDIYFCYISLFSDLTPEQQEEYTKKLDGSIIVAKSITSEHIVADDLTAFGATIAGFKIGDGYSEDNTEEASPAIYSTNKHGIHSGSGIYLGSDGQISFGNEVKFIKYYEAEDGIHLDISTDHMRLKVIDGKPCLELGAIDGQYKQQLTDTENRFMDGTVKVASISNQALNVDTANVECLAQSNPEVTEGHFEWSVRANGNYGLMWKEDN